MKSGSMSLGDGATDAAASGALGSGIGKIPKSWDLEADVVVIGAGAAGLSAAIKAADAGASVIVVETNYDIGGHAIISGGNVPLGGGTSAQKKYGIEDSPGGAFRDLTDWTIVQNKGSPALRHNRPDAMPALAGHFPPTYEVPLGKRM